MSQQCSGNCVPLYLFGGIAGLGMGANLLFNQKQSFSGRLWSLFKSSLWTLLFGMIIYMLCRSCQYQYAYLALIVPSIIFGVSMFILMLQNRAISRQTSVKNE